MGCSTLVEKFKLPSAVNSKGAVSPATRAMPTRQPVTMPLSAVRATILSEVRQRGYPRASAASRQRRKPVGRPDDERPGHDADDDRRRAVQHVSDEPHDKTQPPRAILGEIH